MIHLSRRLAWCALAFSVAGCSTEAGPPEAKPTPQAKALFARMELSLAEQGALIAEAERGAQTLESRVSGLRLGRDLELAEAALVQFRDVESVRRTQEARLEVLKAQDQIQDAREELEQLEKLYQGNELADATKEIVLRRGRSSLERAAAEVAIKELQLKTLKEDLLPLELGKLQLDVDRKKDEAARAALAAQIASMQKGAALGRAKVEVQKAEDALSEAEKK